MFLSGGCVRDVFATEAGLCLSDAGRPIQPQLHQRQAPETVLLEEMEAAVSASAQSDSFPAGLPVHLWDSFLSQPDGAVERTL